MREPKLTFGDRDDMLVHVSEVDSGLRCGCTCPACGEPLIARNGKRKVHHFGHKPGADCTSAVETALHRAAKQVLVDAGYLRIPPVEVQFESYKESWSIHPEQTIQFDAVHPEQRHGEVIPDLTVDVGDRRLFVEIVVTHDIDENKEKALRGMDVSVLAIDLSSVARAASLEEIRKLVVDGVESKRWVINVRADEVRRQAVALGRFLPPIQRGMATHVDGCPSPYARKYKGKAYANILRDCLDCGYNVEGGFPGVTCLGFEQILSYEDFRRRIAEDRARNTMPKPEPPERNS